MSYLSLIEDMDTFMDIESIYSLIRLNTDKFFDFMSKSIMNHIDDTNTTTLDLYICLSRILRGYNMFVNKVFHYPFKQQKLTFKCLDELLKEKIPDEPLCVISEPELVEQPKEQPKTFKVNMKFYYFFHLIEIQNEYGLIDNILKYLMTKLFSFHYKTIIDKKINTELLSDKRFYDYTHKLAMLIPVLLNSIKEFMV